MGRRVEATRSRGPWATLRGRIEPGPLIVLLLLLAVIVWHARRGQGEWAGSSPGLGSKTVTRTYSGSAQRAAEAFQRDAVSLARDGYFPISQIYTPGSHGCGAFLVALLLFVVLVGILIFIYMLIVKPDGTLVVTYEYRPPLPTRPAVGPAPPEIRLEPEFCFVPPCDSMNVCRLGQSLLVYRNSMPSPQSTTAYTGR